VTHARHSRRRASPRRDRRGALLAFAIACASRAASAESANADAREHDRDLSGGAPAALAVNGSLTGVTQAIDGRSAADGAHDARANYRGDVTATLPAGSLRDAEGKLFVHVRFGDGNGIALRSTYTSTANTTVFAPSDGTGGVYAIVAQAWYQLDVPAPRSVATPDGNAHVAITAGKIDPFAFFDQNAAADDETTRFLNNAFVHNPLLDSGGDVGVDRYGFTPAVRVAYVDARPSGDSYAASVAMTGSGPGAHLTGSAGDWFVIGQIEATSSLASEQPGTYRLYAWRNGRASDFDGSLERHAGWGVSADQRAGESVTLFTRFGREMHGQVRFDRALTFGAEIGGRGWRRAQDALGIAAGVLRTSDAYHARTADGSIIGYSATGTEQLAELYYRVRIGEHVDVTPDVQWIRRPGGDPAAPTIFVAGLRARVGF
jgi:high affinity Mn2+ porin